MIRPRRVTPGLLPCDTGHSELERVIAETLAAPVRRATDPRAAGMRPGNPPTAITINPFERQP